MTYSTEIEIELPREKVIDLYTNKALLPQWHPSIKEIKLISGLEGETNAKYKILMMDGQTVKFESTITKNKLPDE